MEPPPDCQQSSADDAQERERLTETQRRREQLESEDAQRADEPEEQLMHERRADKASYLREKLEEQESSEHE